MNVANASFSQMPFHQRIVTRSPNHMWASSWATTSATFCCSACVLVAGSTQQQALAERDAAEVLHRAGGEVGQGEEVDLVARVRDAVVVLEPAQREGADVEAEAGEVALAGHVHDAQRDAVDVDRRRWPRAGRRRRRRGTCSSIIVSAKRTATLPVRPASARSTSGPLDTASRSGSTTSVMPNTALKSGSSQHGNARRQSVACICVVAMTRSAPAVVRDTCCGRSRAACR